MGRALDAFRSGRAFVMVATDVAARGLDVKCVRLVVVYDVGKNREDHVHRIGRTGRGQAEGTAVTFIDGSRAAEIVRWSMENAGLWIPADLERLCRRKGIEKWRDNGSYKNELG